MSQICPKTKVFIAVAVTLAWITASEAAWLGPKRSYGFKSTSTAPVRPASVHVHLSHSAACGIAYGQRPVSRIHTTYAPSRRTGLRLAGFHSSAWRPSLNSYSRVSYRSQWRHRTDRTGRSVSLAHTYDHGTLNRTTRQVYNPTREHLYLPDVRHVRHSPQVVVNNYYGQRPLSNKRRYNAWEARSRQTWHDRFRHNYRFDNMPRLHVVQILGVIDNDSPSSFDLPPASLERNAEILDLPAWKQLRAGQSASAYASFKTLAPKAANSSAAMIGYAIAAAEQKKLHVASFAMRQAYENDPEGTASMNLTFDLQKRVKKLAKRAVVTARQYGGDYADSQFLHAAFSALAMDKVAARQSIEKVISRGDRSASAENLQLAVSLDLPESLMLADLL